MILYLHNVIGICEIIFSQIQNKSTKRRIDMYKKLTFKVHNNSKANVTDLIKEVNGIAHRIRINLEKNLITFENIENFMFDNVIEAVEKHYTILSIDIDNTDNAITETAQNLQEIDMQHQAKSKNIELYVEDVVESNYSQPLNEETAIVEIIGDALSKLNKAQNPEDQIASFLTDLGMPVTNKVLTTSFIIACNIKKINYENVLLELKKKYPNIGEKIIKASLREEFKNWLKQYPALSKKYPKISIMTLLKVFAKEFK